MRETKNPIIALIEQEAKAKGLSLTSLSRKIGIADTTLTKKKNADGAPNARTLQKVGEFFNKPASYFLAALGGGAANYSSDVQFVEITPQKIRRTAQDLPVKGTAAGAAVGGFRMTEKTVQFVARPPGLESVADAYAIFVVNSSMEPRHRPGELCFIHPHKPPTAGDSVIITVKTHDNAPTETYIKRFRSETRDEIIVEQLNPVATIRYKKTAIVQIHKVMTLNELFGV